MSDHTPAAGDGEESISGWNFGQGEPMLPGYAAWDLLGQGRRFETWIAWSAERYAPVCIKIPRLDSLRSRSTLDALARELEAAGAMSHPAIPRVLAADLSGATVMPHIVYEFIEGRPLPLILEEDGPLDAHDVVFVGLQLAAALHHVHGRGFVHLDLKPSNVTLRGERAILLDFDIALPIGGQRSTTRPRGTAWYMAPEQIRCEPAHPSMDLFALGALLFEAATDERLFDLDTDELPTDSDELPTRFPQVSETRPPIAELAPALTPGVAAVVETLLAIDPADRPPDAATVIDLLDAALPPGTDPLWPSWVPAALRGAGPSPARADRARS